MKVTIFKDKGASDLIVDELFLELGDYRVDSISLAEELGGKKISVAELRKRVNPSKIEVIDESLLEQRFQISVSKENHVNVYLDGKTAMKLIVKELLERLPDDYELRFE
jgi:hypothetical protein